MTLKTKTCRLLEHLKQRLEVRRSGLPQGFWSDAMDRWAEAELINRHGY